MLLGALGLYSFVFVDANPKLYLVPRYLVVAAWAAWAAGMFACWWLVALWADGRHKLSAAGVAVLLLANVAALSVENMQWARQWAWPSTAPWQGDWCSSAAATNGPDQRGAVACPYRRSKWPTKRLRSPSLRS